MENVSFSVDAGIINRLGLELVGKSETALAELIKNSYDADANVVNLYFENADKKGGTLIIEDDGVGMTKTQLIQGFMRLATTDKVHNSISEKYKRPKAGRKGIGRFSTQRLGEKLEIVTEAQRAQPMKLVIDWNKYVTDKDISEIKNELSVLPKESSSGNGTKLRIYRLRDKWSDADIKRVYRFISELIQPDFLQINNNEISIDESRKEGFEVSFFRRNNKIEDWTKVADPQVMMLNRALAIFSGYLDNEGVGRCLIESKKFTIEGKKVVFKDEIEVNDSSYITLNKARVAFKAYYFIGGDRNIYYGITKPELNSILEHLNKNGGIKLYRNGFRVPKYGDIENDWLNIDKKARIGQGIPFNNNRLLGFVQLLDANGEVFEESAGREGLIEKEAFNLLQDFVSRALRDSFTRFASWFRNTDEFKLFNPNKKPSPTTSSVQQNITELKAATRTLTNPDASEQEKQEASTQLEKATKSFIHASNAAIDELEMMRVLAGTGLTIAEFVHEVKQIVPATKGYILDTLKKKIDNEVYQNLKNIIEILSSLEAYTSYFDETISKNVVRDLRPIDLRMVVKSFKTIISWDLTRRKIDMEVDLKGQDLITKPMHPSEWNTILQNLYSNAKKAILRSEVSRGKILLQVIKDSEKSQLILTFSDNGVGIPVKYRDKIFNPFFTTSVERNDDLGTGSGLGLYILFQMIYNRGGTISVVEAHKGYHTSININIPLASSTELKKYGY